MIEVLEVKSQAGSFGSNYNNRTKEAICLAVDTRKAYEQGLLGKAPALWMGYMMVLEDCERSTCPSRRFAQPHFPIDPAFTGASYGRRYELSYLRMLKQGLYNSMCLVLGHREGPCREPAAALGFEQFVQSLSRHIGAYYGAIRSPTGRQRRRGNR